MNPPSNDKEELKLLNRDINMFGRNAIEKFKKLKIFLHGLKGVKLCIYLLNIINIFYKT